VKSAIFATDTPQTLPAKTLKTYLELIKDMRNALEPQALGMHYAMFPYFRDFSELLVDLQVKVRKLMEFTADPKNRDQIEEQLKKVQKSGGNGRLASVITRYFYMKDMQKKKEELTLKNFPFSQWGSKQAENFKEILAQMKAYVQEFPISRARMDEWERYLDGWSAQITRNMPPNQQYNEIEHQKMLEKIVYICNKVSMELPLNVYLDRDDIQNELIPLMPPSPPLGYEERSELSARLLAEKVPAKFSAYGYAFSPCKNILREALRFGIFPSKEDEQYKKLREALTTVTPRV
jgi:hypothetical protein